MPDIANPPATPKAICENICHTMPPAVMPPSKRDSITAVSIYDMGSLEPLSTSRRGALLFLRPSFRERSMENTVAASVELMTAPIRKLSSQAHPSAKWQNSPTRTAVRATPTVASSPASTATGLADFHLVPKPP